MSASQTTSDLIPLSTYNATNPFPPGCPVHIHGDPTNCNRWSVSPIAQVVQAYLKISLSGKTELFYEVKVNEEILIVSVSRMSYSTGCPVYVLDPNNESKNSLAQNIIRYSSSASESSLPPDRKGGRRKGIVLGTICDEYRKDEILGDENPMDEQLFLRQLVNNAASRSFVYSVLLLDEFGHPHQRVHDIGTDHIQYRLIATGNLSDPQSPRPVSCADQPNCITPSNNCADNFNLSSSLKRKSITTATDLPSEPSITDESIKRIKVEESEDNATSNDGNGLDCPLDLSRSISETNVSQQGSATVDAGQNQYANVVVQKLSWHDTEDQTNNPHISSEYCIDDASSSNDRELHVRPSFSICLDTVKNSTWTGTGFIGNTKVLVHPLPSWSTEIDVRNYFKSCGEIESVKISGSANKTGVIEFTTQEGRNACVAMNRSIFQGNSLIIEGYSTSKSLSESLPRLDENRSVFVSCSINVDLESLRNKFEECGKIASMRFTENKKKSPLKQFAFIEFVRPESRDVAIRLSGITLLEMPVFVGPIRPSRTSTFDAEKQGYKSRGSIRRPNVPGSSREKREQRHKQLSCGRSKGGYR